jgi:hypothetical protein
MKKAKGRHSKTYASKLSKNTPESDARFTLAHLLEIHSLTGIPRNQFAFVSFAKTFSRYQDPKRSILPNEMKALEGIGGMFAIEKRMEKAQESHCQIVDCFYSSPMGSQDNARAGDGFR